MKRLIIITTILLCLIIPLFIVDHIGNKTIQKAVIVICVVTDFFAPVLIADEIMRIRQISKKQ